MGGYRAKEVQSKNKKGIKKKHRGKNRQTEGRDPVLKKSEIRLFM